MERVRSLIAIVALAGCLGVTGGALAETGYPPPTGKPPWAEQSAEYWNEIGGDKTVCNGGYRQSPIDLTPASPPTDSRLRRIGFVYGNNVVAPAASLMRNAGHTIELAADPDAYVAEPGIMLDGRFFKLDNIHFHYPSEHLLGGVRFAMEMHMVHKAPAPSSDIAVVAVLIQNTAANTAGPLDPLFNAMTGLATKDSKAAAQFDGNQILNALPSDKVYLRYDGSLTTPPCSETVTWLVLKNPVPVADNQIAKFSAAIGVSARPLQPDNGRSLRLSHPFLGDGRADYCRVVNGTLTCALATGRGFGGGIITTGNTPVGTPAPLMGDVNGDGLADYCYFTGSGPYNITCALATGTGFGAFTSWGQNLASTSPNLQFLADVDGDGRADYCRSVGSGATYVMSCLLATTEGGFGTQTVNSEAAATGDQWAFAFMVDVNADGRADYCRLLIGSGATSRLSCALSTGIGFGPSDFNTSNIDITNWQTPVWMADVNSDGRADFCRYTGNDTTSGMVSCALATGAGFGAWSFNSYKPFNRGDPLTGNWGDSNGDGRADFCRAVGTTASSPYQCAVATPKGFVDNTPPDTTLTLDVSQVFLVDVGTPAAQ